jgi:hypothetical protein
LKIARFRNTPYLLGFQDVTQLRSKFANDWKAVLAGINNQIFLPGVSHETGVYASSLLGPTTVLSRTEIDAEGTENDAERVSESRRDFKQPPELRRLVKYRQGIAIIDTADPVLFRFLPRADNGDVAVPGRRVLDQPPTLGEAVQTMKDTKLAQKLSAATPVQSNGHNKDGMVDEVDGSNGDQANQPETRPTLDSINISRYMRSSRFGNDLLPFESPLEEE